MAIVKFGKVSTVGSSGLTAGKIYFETSTGLIKVAKSATEVEVFGSQVKDATYSGNILTITKTDGSNITLNFSDIASASGVMAVFEEIKDELTRVETKITTEVSSAKSTLIGSSSDTSSMNTINAAKKYADEKVAAIPAAIKYKGDGTTITQSGSSEVTFSVGTIAQSKVSGLESALEGKASTTELGEVRTIAEAAAPQATTYNKTEVDSKISAAVGSVYKMKGSVQDVDELLGLSGVVIGDVYNVIEAGTLNDEPFEAGSNFVATKAGAGNQSGMWDKLGGTIDLSEYAKTSTIASTYATKSEVSTLSGKVTTNTNAIATLNGAGEGSVSKKVSDAIASEVERADAAYDTKGSAASVKTTVDNYTVNGLKVSTNPTLSGNNVALSSDYSVADSYTAPVIGDKVDVAIGKLAKGIADASASGVISFGGQTGAITVDTTNSTNGAVKFTMSGKNLTGTVNGLKSAAYTDSSAYATAAQGAKADAALQKASITSGSANGTIAVGGSDVAVKGLGSAAYTESTAYDTKGSASTAEANAKQYADSLMTWEEFE